MSREVLIHSTFSILYCCYKSFSGQTWWLQWISELLHIFSEFQESPINKQALLRMSLAHGYFRIFLNKHFLICQMLWCLFEIIQFIHFYPLFQALGRSLRQFLDKVTWWHFKSTSKEVIWPKTFLNYMHGLKSAILAIFQKGLGWPCPVSAALKNAS